MSEKIVGYIHKVFRPENKVSKAGNPYRVKKILLLTNDGIVWVHVTQTALFPVIDKKYKPGDPVVIFPTMRIENTVFVGMTGRIIPAIDEYKKQLRPYEELRKSISSYNFSSVKDVLEGDYGYYTVYAEVYRISNVVPIQKGDKKYTKLRIGIEDYTGNLFASTFRATELLKVAGMTEDDVWQIYDEEMSNVKTNDEKEIRDKKKNIQKKIAEKITGVQGRTFVITLKKTKYEKQDGTVTDDYLITRIEDPTTDSIKALGKEVIA